MNSAKALNTPELALAGKAQAPAQALSRSGRAAKGAKASISSTGTIVAISIYLLLPLLLTLLYSLFHQWNDVLPKGFTLEYYAQIFTEAGFLMPLVRTLVISMAPMALCITAVLGAVYVTSIVYPRMQKAMELVCTIPYALQGIILAISVLSLYAGLPRPFSNRVLMLVGTYCVVVLPYIYRGILNSLQAIHARQLIDAARLLGCGPFRAYCRVVVPNIIKGIKISAMLAVALLFGDFVIANIIGGSYYQTAQMYLYKTMFKSGQLSSAIIMVLFIVTLLISACVFRQKKEKKEEM